MEGNGEDIVIEKNFRSQRTCCGCDGVDDGDDSGHGEDVDDDDDDGYDSGHGEDVDDDDDDGDDSGHGEDDDGDDDKLDTIHEKCFHCHLRRSKQGALTFH